MARDFSPVKEERESRTERRGAGRGHHVDLEGLHIVLADVVLDGFSGAQEAH